ncbi:serine palmitoyltransferase [Stella humosa]|uniref:Serine palmitoyltransferase n=2 Tax=Stella humosa TaxID=94 RepID=A0A3N1LYM0_9PROT|nr:aminotransferase class I/II-fold pyridoxal phosphate-dependent enzyme [Stella humosa]ROQ00324.1 serine palmitoyltransferase [Stella humosa]
MAILEKFAHLRGAYQELRSQGSDPFAVRFDRILSPTEGLRGSKRTILFGTNNYLGLTFDASCIEAGIDQLQQSGTGTTGSRIANGSYDGHTRLERELADYYGRAHGMVFTTGYQANLGIISTLVAKGDYLIIDADSHASIYDGARLGTAQVIRFRHNDPEDLRKRLARLPATGSKLIVVEGIYSMLGDAAPLREIAAVKAEAGAYLLVDEAHSLGVLGQKGRGLAEAAGVEDEVDFIVGTFSKTLGTIGGFCVSDLEDFDVLRVACRPYMFTASLPPSLVASTLQALKRLRTDPGLRARLRANSRRFHAGLEQLGFRLGSEPSPIVAVIQEDRDLAVAFWNRLLESGLYVNLALPPATPNGSAILRCSVSAAHSTQQIDTAIAMFAAVGEELGVLAPQPMAATG